MRLSAERLRGAFLWLTGFSGAFVFTEPSPYEIVSILTILLFAATGLSFRPMLAPMALLLVLYITGFGIAVVQVSDQARPVIWVLISGYLAATAVFFAAMLGTHTQSRLDLLMRGYLAAALIASTIAVAAYFRLFGDFSDTFLLYGRARGTFNDPNVLGAFLILPALLAFQRVLTGQLSAAIRGGIVMHIILAAMFLSFSRAAWAQFAFCALAIMGLTFVTSHSRNERYRVVLVATIGLMAIIIFVAVLLSIGQVAELFKERAALEQSYDVGHFGRFGRYALGLDIALVHPFGIGPLQFATIFPEDPHNTYLNAFVSGGWLSGFTYLTLTAVTGVIGFRFILAPTPWRPTYHAAYAAFLGVVIESFIIDSDHWRHYFIILGVLWGLMAASRLYLVNRGPLPSYPAGALARTTAPA